MEWFELIVHTTPAGEDLISALLMEAGAAGTEIIDRQDVLNMPQAPGMWDLIDDAVLANMPEDVLVKAYFEKSASAAETVALVRARLAALPELTPEADLGSLTIDEQTVRDEDWSELWKQYYKPFRVGERLIVKPTWEEYAPLPKDLILELDPGMAFGTGQHETTTLCMELLEQWIVPGCRCIDVGTGTGILAIAAAKLGAGEVLAIDIDQDAVRVAARNVVQNHCDRVVNVRQGDLLKGAADIGQADVMVANIIADVICMLAEPARAHIREGGALICSGIIREREQDVQNALAAAGYTVARRLSKGEWVCLGARR